jgi:hypothetical protein
MVVWSAVSIPKIGSSMIRNELTDFAGGSLSSF